MNTQPLAAATAAFVMMALLGCTGPACTEPTGAWTNREGQTFVFNQQGKGLWLTRFGTTFDTVSFGYAIDCKNDPATIDMKAFNAGPHEGKTLFGIIEMSTDSSFRIRYEAGDDASVRPETFDSDQTVKFYKSRQ